MAKTSCGVNLDHPELIQNSLDLLIFCSAKIEICATVEVVPNEQKGC